MPTPHRTDIEDSMKPGLSSCLFGLIGSSLYSGFRSAICLYQTCVPSNCTTTPIPRNEHLRSVFNSSCRLAKSEQTSNLSNLKTLEIPLTNYHININSISLQSATQEQVNIAQKAHIYSFSSDGPRGKEKTPSCEINELSNLMLVCHEC